MASRRPPTKAPASKPNGFVQVPSALLFRTDLSDAELRLYEALLWHAHGGDECCPSQAALSEELGRPIRTIRWQLARLVNQGLLTMERKGQGRPNIYRLAVTWAKPVDRQPIAGQARRGKPIDRQPIAAGSRSTSLDVGRTASKALDVPPPQSLRGNEEEEEHTLLSHDEAALVQLGVSQDTARELAGLATTETIREACQRTRHRARANPAKFLETTVRRLAVLQDAQREQGGEQGDMAGKLAEAERQATERMAGLKRQWGRLSAARRKGLLSEARRRNPLLRNRAADHPMLLAMAREVMVEQDGAEGEDG